jgi:hypothetical protein
MLCWFTGLDLTKRGLSEFGLLGWKERRGTCLRWNSLLNKPSKSILLVWIIARKYACSNIDGTQILQWNALQKEMTQQVTTITHDYAGFVSYDFVKCFSAKKRGIHTTIPHFTLLPRSTCVLAHFQNIQRRDSVHSLPDTKLHRLGGRWERHIYNKVHLEACEQRHELPLLVMQRRG